MLTRRKTAEWNFSFGRGITDLYVYKWTFAFKDKERGTDWKAAGTVEEEGEWHGWMEERTHSFQGRGQATVLCLEVTFLVDFILLISFITVLLTVSLESRVKLHSLTPRSNV